MHCQILANPILKILQFKYHYKNPTLHCQILAGGIITSMQIGHSSSFLAESTINGTSPVFKRKLVRILQKSGGIYLSKQDRKASNMCSSQMRRLANMLLRL